MEEGNVPDEPDEALSGDVLLGLKLVDNEVLKGFGFERGGELAVADFLVRGKYFEYFPGRMREHSYLDVAQHVIFDGLEGHGA